MGPSGSIGEPDLSFQGPLVVPIGLNNDKMAKLSFEDTMLNVAQITPDMFAKLN